MYHIRPIRTLAFLTTNNEICSTENENGEYAPYYLIVLVNLKNGNSQKFIV